MASRNARLAIIATLGGVFSGVFGVGGGAVIVPLLILWLGYEEREATGTSLVAIALIGTLAAGAHAYRGAVDVPSALVVGLPAVVGVVAGTALQQRVPARAFSGAFALILVVAAGLLVL